LRNAPNAPGTADIPALSGGGTISDRFRRAQNAYRMWRNVALGTALVGVLDITEVIGFYYFQGVAPVRILQAVAAGLIGRDRAFSGGMTTAALGLLIHFCIAFVVVLIYHLAARQSRTLRTQPFVMGTLYGVAVYLLMNFAVLPFTATGSPRLTPFAVVANGLFAHVVCVGIPAALTARSV
jgi:hypothetical protein